MSQSRVVEIADARARIVSGQRVLEHVRVADLHGQLGQERLRVVRAVPFALHALGSERVGGSAEVVVGLDELASVLGVGEGDVDAAVQFLAGAGVLVVRPEGERRRIQLVPAVLEPSFLAELVRWDRVLEVARGDLAALLVAQSMADVIPDPVRWQRIKRSKLEIATTYSRKTIRRAVSRLVAGGVLEEQEERGGENLYRFGAYARGEAAERAPRRQERANAADADRTQPAAPAVEQSSMPAVQLGPGVGVTVEIAGVRLVLLPGAVVEMERRADGVVYRVPPHLVIGPLPG